jgi:NADH-quinone oxidoreductase subunit A
VNAEFLTVLVFTAIGGGFVLASLVAGWFIRPKFPNADKETIYECGERPFSSAWFNFNPRFYIIALIFIVFDVALAMLFAPLSVMSQMVGSAGQWVIAGVLLFFIATLVLGLAYVWGKGDLEWIKK